jgi:hypothetical protein
MINENVPQYVNFGPERATFCQKKKHQHVPKKTSLSQTKELTLHNEGSQKSHNDDDLNDAEK